MATGQQPALERPLHRERQLTRADGPAVGDQVQVATVGAMQVRRADQPLHLNARLALVVPPPQRRHLDERVGEGASVHGRHRLAERYRIRHALAGSRRVERHATVRGHAEGDRGIGQRQLRHHAHGGCRLCARRAQEAASRRQRGEEVAHVDAGAFAGRGAALPHEPSAAQPHAGGGALRGRSRHEVHVRRRGHGGQRLATEAQRADREQLLGGAQLARRVALEGIGQLLGRDAVAVVVDLDAVDAAALEQHLDVPSPSIHGVLDQLLDHTGRPLDHLAGGDAVRHLRRQHPDTRRRGLKAAAQLGGHAQPSMARRSRARRRSS